VTIELYGHPFSSYTWKAHIPLIANGTRHDFKMLDPGHPNNLAFVGEAHPAGKVPVLRDGDNVVVEATAIVEYLAVHHPGIAPLIPEDPAEAATARMLDRVFDHYVMANVQRAVAAWFVNRDNPGEGLREAPDPVEAGAGKAGLLRAYRWLEDWLGAHQFPNHVSLVTCAAAPSLFYAYWIEPIPEDCPKLAALRAELLELQAVIEVVDAARPYRKLFPGGAPERD
jgi:glutathione S-transferase